MLEMLPWGAGLMCNVSSHLFCVQICSPTWWFYTVAFNVLEHRKGQDSRIISLLGIFYCHFAWFYNPIWQSREAPSWLFNGYMMCVQNSYPHSDTYKCIKLIWKYLVLCAFCSPCVILIFDPTHGIRSSVDMSRKIKYAYKLCELLSRLRNYKT